ncbi:hypothetical protein KA977_04315 [Candidatus Dependentiae bacterium]|nr:hypothetical protein [Candidatus Dependentiae bacterium]
MKKKVFLSFLIVFWISISASALSLSDVSAKIWLSYTYFDANDSSTYSSIDKDLYEIYLATLNFTGELYKDIDGKFVLYFEDSEDKLTIDELSVNFKNVFTPEFSILVGRSYVPFGLENKNVEGQKNTLRSSPEYWWTWVTSNMINAKYEMEDLVNINLTFFEGIDTYSEITSANRLIDNYSIKIDGYIPLPIGEKVLLASASFGKGLSFTDKKDFSIGLLYTCPFIKGAQASIEYLNIKDYLITAGVAPVSEKIYGLYAGYEWNSWLFSGRYSKLKETKINQYRLDASYKINDKMGITAEYGKGRVTEQLNSSKWFQLALKSNF